MASLRARELSYVLVFCGVTTLAASAGESAIGTGQGVWQKHDYNFQFLGFTTTYSCEGLASKLKVLLMTAGAREDAKAVSVGCSRDYGVPDKLAQSRLTFYTLAPVGGAENASPPINGVWRSVAFAERSPREVALGDCELVEQFRDKVLPMFTTRNVDNRMTCVPHQVSGSVINLKFEAFAGVPAVKKK